MLHKIIGYSEFETCHFECFSVCWSKNYFGNANNRPCFVCFKSKHFSRHGMYTRGQYELKHSTWHFYASVIPASSVRYQFVKQSEVWNLSFGFHSQFEPHSSEILVGTPNKHERRFQLILSAIVPVLHKRADTNWNEVQQRLATAAVHLFLGNRLSRISKRS